MVNCNIDNLSEETKTHEEKYDLMYNPTFEEI